MQKRSNIHFHQHLTQIRNPKSEIRNSKDHVVFVVGVTSPFFFLSDAQ